MHNNPCQPRQRYQPPRPNLRVRQRQTNQSVDSFSNQTDARMEIIASMPIRALMASACGMAPSLTIFRLVHIPGDNSLLDQTVRSQLRRSRMPNPRAKQLTPRDPTKSRRRNPKASHEAKEARLRLQPRAEMSILTTTPRLTTMTKRKTRLMINLKKTIQKRM